MLDRSKWGQEIPKSQTNFRISFTPLAIPSLSPLHEGAGSCFPLTSHMASVAAASSSPSAFSSVVPLGMQWKDVHGNYCQHGKPCICKGIRLEKEAFAICQFSPTKKPLPDIQADQIAPLLSEGSKSKLPLPWPWPKGRELLGWRGWSPHSLQTLPWLHYSAEMVEFIAWQGIACVTLSQGHTAAAAHLSLDALDPSAALFLTQMGSRIYCQCWIPNTFTAFCGN